MRRVLVFQHVAHEILGTLNPLLKQQRFRIRYVNFDRSPEERPSTEKYDGLVVLGGWMGVYEADRYQHIKVECQLIERALERKIPVLGICLGSQILAHVLGAPVRKHTEREAGWHEIELTDAGRADPLLTHVQAKESIFQMHGDTFDMPVGAVHLARSKLCASQAFRYGDNAYGLQFHLEVDQGMINRYLSQNRRQMDSLNGCEAMEKIERETEHYLPRSMELSQKTFSKFLEFFPVPERVRRRRVGHVGR